ncbi:hypothetical protein [Trujillonella endophytica]|uniref:Uncharacterized protein n=1 Tax=Trujillonella endophytica TaxID=673521 RepID=A0A1H8VJ59_9ACTN|nr:hypothetical protein [Trujillella endophytica]SEP15411.1 hypothetical protein SAMN05660991_03593 [Trujillella endophytica]
MGGRLAIVPLDDVADELYAGDPDEFVADRNARAAEARADGDRVLAKEIAALPKPSTAAWVVNVLVRAHRDEIEALVELGGLLREAQESLAGDQLRALNAQRGQLLSALTRQAAARARERGRPVSTAVAGQVEETLRAAMADPGAGEAVLGGRLSSPLSYSGMGGVTGVRPQLRVVREPAPAPPRRSRAGEDRGDGDRRAREEERLREREEAARRAAEEQHRREVAQAREEATAAAELAEETAVRAEEERDRAGELDERHERLRARVEELSVELARAEEEAGEAAAELRRAERHRTTAERQARDAAAARDRALARLRELEEG